MEIEKKNRRKSLKTRCPLLGFVDAGLLWTDITEHIDIYISDFQISSI